VSVGEGAGFVVVESLERARDRGAAIAAVIAGYGHSCDAHHLTAPDPAGAGAARAIRVALASAGIGPGEIGFVNAHGTATPHNDRAELAALSLALGPHLERCPVHSVKACLGHCMGAAGVIETIVAIRSLGAGVVPHTPGLEQPERPGAADFVMGQPRRVETDYALTNSFGFGGNDAVLVLARPEVVT